MPIYRGRGTRVPQEMGGRPMNESRHADGDARSGEPRIADVVRLAAAAGPPDYWSERSSKQKAAADLLPELIDEGIVDRVLALGEGTTRRWFDEDEEFRNRVVSRRRALESSRDPDIEYARALTPKQIRTGILLVEGERTQTEVAE